MKIYYALLAILFLVMIYAMASAADATQPSQPPTIAEWMKAEVKQHDGVIYWRIPIGNMNWCFTRATDEIVSIPDKWQSLAGMAIKTIPLSMKEYQVCTDTLPPVIWLVAKNPSATDTPPTRPLKDGVTMVNTWRILVSIPCEPATVNVIKTGQEYHWATNSDGQRGITVCSKQ